MQHVFVHSMKNCRNFTSHDVCGKKILEMMILYGDDSAMKKFKDAFIQIVYQTREVRILFRSLNLE